MTYRVRCVRVRFEPKLVYPRPCCCLANESGPLFVKPLSIWHFPSIRLNMMKMAEHMNDSTLLACWLWSLLWIHPALGFAPCFQHTFPAACWGVIWFGCVPTQISSWMVAPIIPMCCGRDLVGDNWIMGRFPHTVLVVVNTSHKIWWFYKGFPLSLGSHSVLSTTM